MPLSDDEQFKEGQKLEAVDPLEMSRICPATVAKVHYHQLIVLFYIIIVFLIGT